MAYRNKTEKRKRKSGVPEFSFHIFFFLLGRKEAKLRDLSLRLAAANWRVSKGQGSR